MASEPADEDQAKAEDERLIREKAYQLWRADGALEGKADHYWHLARKLISQGESPKSSASAPSPRARGTSNRTKKSPVRRAQRQ
jgi:hypothetical protein